MLRERGQREVFCGLTGIVWLHRKIQDAFFLVVGSRTCAHLIQSAAGVMIFAEPRFATAIIDERDLAGIADMNEELDRVVGAAARPPAGHPAAVPGRLLPVRGDQARPVARRRRPVAQLLAAGAGAELFRQRHRDHLHAGRGRLPRLARAGPARRARRRADSRCSSSARWPTWSRTSSPGCSPRMGIGPTSPSCRRGSADALPAVGPGHARFCSPSPSSPTRPARSKSAARRRLAAPFPLGAEGTTAWLRPRPTRSTSPPRLFDAVTAPARARAEKALAAPPRAALAGKRIFLFPDSQLEIPLARFLPARWA